MNRLLVHQGCQDVRSGSGAASGIGRAIAEAVVKSGGRVIAFDLNEDALAAAAAETGTSYIPFTGSVAEEEAMRSAVAFADKELEGSTISSTSLVRCDLRQSSIWHSRTGASPSTSCSVACFFARNTWLSE